MLTAPERRLRGLLSLLSAAFFLAVVLYLLGPLAGPLKAFCRHLPFVSNSVVKVGILGMFCLYAAGDVRRRAGLVPIVLAAHVVSILAMLGVLFLGGDVTRLVEVAGRRVPVSQILWLAIGLDGLITALLAGFYLPARRELVAHAPGDDSAVVTAEERRLRWLLRALTVLFALAGLGYALGPLMPSTRHLFVELPFVTNSVVEAAALALGCWYAGRRLRRNMAVAGLVVAAHVLSVLALGVLFLWGPKAATPDELLMRRSLLPAAAVDGAIAVVLFTAYQAAWFARFERPRFLRPTEYRALIALAEVVIPGPQATLTPAQIAANVDRYIDRIRARRRWINRAALFALQLHPVLYLKAPLSELDQERRRDHLATHFQRVLVLPVLPEFWRRLVQALIRVGKQLVYVAYYNDRATDASVGYVRFSERPRGKSVPKSSTTLEVVEGDAIPDRLEAEVCIVGSGAAGAILAYHLAQQGRSVLVVERGRYVRPADFSEDEVEMIGKLYADGVFQQTEDFRFTILQGSCVGGSTTVNNAVCFDPPDRVLRRWNDPYVYDAGLDLPAVRQSVQHVRSFLQIAPQASAVLNPSAPKFLAGAALPGPAAAALKTGVVDANIKDCLGTGYCNIGCAYGRKLSMLEAVLPRAQKEFPGKVRIVSECEVELLRTVSGRPPRILDARARTPGGRTVTVKADSFILSAGTIASSWLLMRSGVGRGLPVGQGVSFNMGSPVTAEFPDTMNAYDGLQISHFGLPDPERGFVVETWWNPPATQAVNMPGWFEDHFENMRRYPKLMAVGILVGTERNARVVRALTGGPGVDYTPDAGDLRKLADGLTQTAEILFAAGARRVMLNTWAYDNFTHPNQLGGIYRIAEDPRALTLGTGHPQGGNAVSRDPARGVVDPGFRVHGYGNLYVCDASVFPGSVTVNPQLTVMALAHYASQRIH